MEAAPAGEPAAEAAPAADAAPAEYAAAEYTAAEYAAPAAEAQYVEDRDRDYYARERSRSRERRSGSRSRSRDRRRSRSRSRCVWAELQQQAGPICAAVMQLALQHDVCIRRLQPADAALLFCASCLLRPGATQPATCALGTA